MYKLASLFDKRETSPLSLIKFSSFIIILMALNNNPNIRNIPFVYISLSVIQIIFCISIIIKGIMLLKGTFKDQLNRTMMEKIQILFIVIFMMIMAFVTIENILHTTSYTRMFFNRV